MTWNINIELSKIIITIIYYYYNITMLNGYEPIIQNITSGFIYSNVPPPLFSNVALPVFDISGVNGNSTVSISGEFILETVSQIIGSCPVSFRYVIKMIDTLSSTYYIKWATNLESAPAIFNTSNLTTNINEALLFERITYDELKNIAALANSNWTGFDATVYENQCWLRTTGNYINISTYQYFKIHNTFNESGLLTLSNITEDIAERISEYQSWYILPTVKQLTGCDWNCELLEQTTQWSRATSDCIDLSGAVLPDGEPMTIYDLNEKRKATIFQYKQNGAGFSKKQNYSRLARGLGRQRGQSFATQSDTYTNANTRGLPIVNNRILSCLNVTKNWALTNQNDTPGPVRRITNYPTVPLTNYIVRRTYLAGGGKWPQYGWAPGNMGFPVRKKGNL
jgi:hypothetical protein